MKTLLLFALVCSALAIPQAHLNAAFEAQTTAKVLNVISSHKSPLLESVEALIEAGKDFAFCFPPFLSFPLLLFMIFP